VKLFLDDKAKAGGCAYVALRQIVIRSDSWWGLDLPVALLVTEKFVLSSLIRGNQNKQANGKK
jgi:hypothetical protein